MRKREVSWSWSQEKSFLALCHQCTFEHGAYSARILWASACVHALCKVVGNCRVGVPGRSPSYWHVRCLRHLKGPTSLRVARGKHLPLQKTFTPFCLGLPKWFLLKTAFLRWPARTADQWSLFLHETKHAPPPPNTFFPSAWVYDLAVLSRREAGKAHLKL